MPLPLHFPRRPKGLFVYSSLFDKLARVRNIDTLTCFAVMFQEDRRVPGSENLPGLCIHFCRFAQGCGHKRTLVAVILCSCRDLCGSVEKWQQLFMSFGSIRCIEEGGPVFNETKGSISLGGTEKML
jgi:hypothetical protein